MRAALASTTTNFPSSSADTRRAMAAAVPTTVEPLMTYARLALIVSLSGSKPRSTTTVFHGDPVWMETAAFGGVAVLMGLVNALAASDGAEISAA